jgi:hypothetical protein
MALQPALRARRARRAQRQVRRVSKIICPEPTLRRLELRAPRPEPTPTRQLQRQTSPARLLMRQPRLRTREQLPRRMQTRGREALLLKAVRRHRRRNSKAATTSNRSRIRLPIFCAFADNMSAIARLLRYRPKIALRNPAACHYAACSTIERACEAIS